LPFSLKLFFPLDILADGKAVRFLASDAAEEGTAADLVSPAPGYKYKFGKMPADGMVT